MTEATLPGWMRNVVVSCAERGGRITSEEIAHAAALADKFALGSTLVSHLKKSKLLLVEVLDEQTGGHGPRKIKIYRVTRREPT